jgi:hypothetical protein
MWDPIRGMRHSLMTLEDHLLMAKAPKNACPPTTDYVRPAGPGTEVTVRKYPIKEVDGGKADHMYVQYDDGRSQVIARGGPSRNDDGAIGDFLTGGLTVRADVDPAAASRDYGRGQQTVFRGFIPGVTMQQATAPARRRAAGVNASSNAYGLHHNSNSFAADDVEARFGCRPGDPRTPGYGNRLRTVPRDPQQVLGVFPMY